MVAVSAFIVILAGIIVVGLITGVVLCKSSTSRLILLCLSLVGSLVVLVLIIWMLCESASQGDWRAIEDTVGAWLLSAAAFSLVVGFLSAAICIRNAKG